MTREMGKAKVGLGGFPPKPGSSRGLTESQCQRPDQRRQFHNMLSEEDRPANTSSERARQLSLAAEVLAVHYEQPVRRLRGGPEIGRTYLSWIKALRAQ